MKNELLSAIDAERWDIDPDFFVDYHNECIDRIAEAVRCSEIYSQNLDMMAMLRKFYDEGYDRKACLETIKRIGGDA